MYDEDDLIGIKHLFYAIQYAQLKYDWAERLIMAGCDDRMAHKWVAEMGHVVDEIERSLRFLVEYFRKKDRDRILEAVIGWANYTHDISAWYFENAMTALQEYMAQTSFSDSEPEMQTGKNSKRFMEDHSAKLEKIRGDVTALLDDIQYTHLKHWPKHLVAHGIDEREAYLWATEISSVLDQYRSSLLKLINVLNETDVDRIPNLVYDWSVYISTVIVHKVHDPMLALEKLIEPMLPPEREGDEE
jgi:hypothetical protein